MSLSDSQTQNGKKSCGTSEVFDSETTVPQPKRRAIVRHDTMNGVHAEDLETGGDGNSREMSDELPVRTKDVFGEIVGKMLSMLKEAFLLRCFGLFPKLPRESERAMKDVSSPYQEAFVTPSAPELPSPFDQFPTDDLEPARFKLNYPKNVGGGANGKGKGN